MARLTRPRPPAKGNATVDWKKVANTLADTPDQAVLFDEFADTPRVKSLLTMVNGGKVAALNDLPGTVRAFMRQSYMDHSGRRRGQVWLCFYPE